MPAQICHFKPGQVLFREEDHASHMFLLKKGCVSIRKKKGAAFVEIARIYHGEVVGEIAFFDRNPRSATAIAINDVEAVKIDFKSLDEIYKKTPAYLKTIMTSVAERLRRADQAIQRLQKNLIEEAEVIPNDPDTEKPQDAIEDDSEALLRAADAGFDLGEN
jgi:CRP/FNR family transcriptional regulator, cyclic AMP receptor protein